MYIQLPFPLCPKCHNKTMDSFHKNCGGKLQINPSINEVYCPKCNKKWNIWDSNYYCSCGNVFTAKDIYNELKNILELCQLCADELNMQSMAKRKRVELVYSAKRSYVEKFVKSVGYVAGVLFQNIVRIIMDFLTKV